MYLKNRTCGEYLSGLKTFILVAEADKSNQNKSVICCPCVDCENVTEFSSSMHVHAHLIIRGFMDDYKCWNRHGEEGVNARDLKAGRKGDGIPANQQTDYQDASQDGGQDGSQDGGHDGSQDGGEALRNDSEDDLVHIGDNYVHIADQLEELVRDAMGYDGILVMSWRN